MYSYVFDINYYYVYVFHLICNVFWSFSDRLLIVFSYISNLVLLIRIIIIIIIYYIIEYL